MNSMLREQILGRYRGGVPVAEIAAELELPVEVCNVAIIGVGGSSVARAAERAAAEEEEDVSREEAKEMLGIIKNIAKTSENEFTQLSAAKFVYGVRAGHHRSYLDLNPNRGHLFEQINQAYANAQLRARQVLSGKAAAAPVVVDVTPKENAS